MDVEKLVINGKNYNLWELSNDHRKIMRCKLPVRYRVKSINVDGSLTLMQAREISDEDFWLFPYCIKHPPYGKIKILRNGFYRSTRPLKEVTAPNYRLEVLDRLKMGDSYHLSKRGVQWRSIIAELGLDHPRSCRLDSALVIRFSLAALVAIYGARVYAPSDISDMGPGFASACRQRAISVEVEITDALSLALAANVAVALFAEAEVTGVLPGSTVSWPVLVGSQYDILELASCNGFTTPTARCYEPPIVLSGYSLLKDARPTYVGESMVAKEPEKLLAAAIKYFIEESQWTKKSSQ